LTEEDFGVSKQTVYLAVDFAINEGQSDAFESIAQAMVAGTQKEPGALGYEWYLSADRKRCRLIETYADANAVLAHFNGPVVQELVPKIIGTASVTGFEVCGDPGATARAMLAPFGAEIFEFSRGLGPLNPPRTG
jgi:quinol monooxygenase YgiN